MKDGIPGEARNGRIQRLRWQLTFLSAAKVFRAQLFLGACSEYRNVRCFLSININQKFQEEFVKTGGEY